jgi:hypothetical protein
MDMDWDSNITKLWANSNTATVTMTGGSSQPSLAQPHFFLKVIFVTGSLILNQ